MSWFVRGAWGVILLACLVFGASVHSQANFSGTWILDRSRSDMKQMKNIAEAQHAGLTMTVDQEGNTVHVTRIFKIEGQERTEVHTYTTDGTETMNTGLRGESVTTRAHWDGGKLVILSTRKVSMVVREVTVESKGIWSLSPDGKTLTIDGTIHAPRGVQRLRMVFDKQ